ncbi:MAG: hypothetical protein WCR74_00125 [Betaproteobacteria bacterium]
MMITNRQSMIADLVEFSLRAALRDNEAGWLREMFEHGFGGFNALSDSELVRELQFRGLLDEDAQASETDSDDGHEVELQPFDIDDRFAETTFISNME